MTLPVVDIRIIGAILRQVAEEAAVTHEASPISAEVGESPRDLTEAVARFLQIAQRLEDQAPAAGTFSVEEMTRFGEYGLTLAASIADQARALNQHEGYARLEAALPALAAWIARRGGQLTLLEPVVNALADIANHTHETDELVSLCRLMGEIIEAAAPSIKQDPDKTNPGRPWRVIVINRAILATRSRNVRYMGKAFEELVLHFPEEASAFFEEGMRQMDALDYPPQVRGLVEKYHSEWSARTLH